MVATKWELGDQWRARRLCLSDTNSLSKDLSPEAFLSHATKSSMIDCIHCNCIFFVQYNYEYNAAKTPPGFHLCFVWEGKCRENHEHVVFQSSWSLKQTKVSLRLLEIHHT